MIKKILKILNRCNSTNKLITTTTEGKKRGKKRKKKSRSNDRTSQKLRILSVFLESLLSASFPLPL